MATETSKYGSADPRYHRFIDAGIGTRADQEVGNDIGCTRQRVEQVRKILGMKSAAEVRLTTNVTRAKELHAEGKTRGQIRDVLEVGKKGLEQLEVLAGVTFAADAPKPRRNVLYPREKVVTALQSSKSLTEAADKLGIQQPAIFRLIDRYDLRAVKGLIPDGRREDEKALTA